MKGPTLHTVTPLPAVPAAGWRPAPMAEAEAGQAMYDLVARLFPLCRSITGEGLRRSLRILGEYLPLTLHEVPSGTRVFDWTVPPEWVIRDAYLEDEAGRRVVDFRRNNLHVVGYAVPVDAWMTLDELQPHLYSLEDQPDAIPYVTSYYAPHWGFCLAHRERERLRPGRYRVFIDSELKDGSLTYAECLLPGRTEEEVFISTYVCHPSMANDELSGPVVAAFLARWVAAAPRRYSYRFVFAPETIGALAYLQQNLEVLRRRVVAGFNVACVGDERAYSYVASRHGDTLADRALQAVLRARHPDFIAYSFLDRGSDERQYGSPGADLPFVSFCRSKYGAFPEYHTSLDDLSLVTPAGLAGSLDVLRAACELLERNEHYRVACVGEPKLSKYGLYPTLREKHTSAAFKAVRDVVAYADGTHDLIALSERVRVPVAQLYGIVERLVGAGVLRAVDPPRTSYPKR